MRSHQLHVKSGDLCEYIFICFDDKYFLRHGLDNIHALVNSLVVEKSYFSGENPAYCRENIITARKLHDEISAPGFFGQTRIALLLAELLIEYHRSLAGILKPEIERNEKLGQVCVCIRKNPAGNHRLDKYAAAAGMCRAKFTREFKLYTGSTFTEFVNGCRLEDSLRHLSEGASIIDAAELSGYANLSYYHRRFREKFGYTPYVVRKMLAQSAHPHILRLAPKGGQLESV